MPIIIINKDFKKAVWEVRRKYNRPYLTKKQLGEAYILFKEAEGNKERFKMLVMKTLQM